MLALLVAFVPFAIAMAATPGPNNVIATASGSTFGFVRTLPLILGVAAGMVVMTMGVGLGLSKVFEAYPQIHVVLKYVGAAYLIYLAWRIATAGRPKGSGETGRPMRFIEAVLFQWVNPKAWLAVIGAIATYTTTGGNLIAETLVISAVFVFVSIPAVSMWTLFGVAVSTLLRSEAAHRLFNYGMAGLLLASLAPVLL